MKIAYKFVLNIMVNNVAYNDSMYSVSIMAVSRFYKKLIPLKLGSIIIVSDIFYITFIESDYFLCVIKTTK